ncbi:MAG: asparagine synthase (glutamine-hydrolyzing) [Ruminococcus sp.]|nr:asparagine synthase (glutamine-hydrolyzing) [Ruminococcus sp.]
MCGICGFTGQIEQRENTIKKMTEVITHRGPDSDGFFSDDYINMGFRRLSIIDLDEGHQPIYNEDKSLVLTFNGEIYNYKDLRKELIELGHSFYTDTDSEVLIHSFEEWGEEMFDHLRGMFGFAIYNRETKALFLARDFFGIKPLHYTVIGDNLCYGSEIKSILEHPEFKKEFNEEALDHYLSFQYCPQPMTFFKNVYCLLPGHFMWFRDGVVETQRYFEAKFKPDHEMTEDEAVDKIEAVFENSVNAHKIADVEVGCFLSSGVDSSYVSTYFKDQKTFTVGFDFGERYNEISWAENLSKELGVEHHTKLISSEEFWAAVPKVQYHMDQPLADPSCIALYFVAKLASEYVKVVLSGEGADELFGGYTCYNDPRVFSLYQKIVPYCIRKAICWVCKKLPDIKGRDYLIRATHPLEKRFIGNAYMYDQKQKKALLKNSALATDPTRLVRRHYTRARRYDDVTKMQYLDINMWMVGDILLKADRMSMANSLELRVPFLDKEVFKVASTIPTDLRVNKYNTKYAMRQAALRHLPQATAEKEKLGFPVPTRVWLKDEHYYGLVKDMFTSPTAEKFFNTNILVEYLDEHFHEKEDNSRKIWTVYVFLVWYQIYFGAVEIEEPEVEEEVFEHQPVEQNPADSPFDDGEDVEMETKQEAQSVSTDDAPTGSTKVFRPVDESKAKKILESENNDVEAEEIYSATKTAKHVNLNADSSSAEPIAASEHKVKPSFKPVLEDHNNFFENLKKSLQEDNIED